MGMYIRLKSDLDLTDAIALDVMRSLLVTAQKSSGSSMTTLSGLNKLMKIYPLLAQSREYYMPMQKEG